MITSEKYREGVLATESNDFEEIRARMGDIDTIRMLHAAIGICTEAGELIDPLKKHAFYGKPLDELNLVEELGDLYWYIEIMQDVLGVTTEEVKQANNNKLRARYGEKFDRIKAIKRDLDKEVEALKE